MTGFNGEPAGGGRAARYIALKDGNYWGIAYDGGDPNVPAVSILAAPNRATAVWAAKQLNLADEHGVAGRGLQAQMHSGKRPK